MRKERVGINCVPDINGKPGLYVNGNYVAFEKTIYEGSNSINNIIYDEELDNPTYVIIEYQADKLNGSVRIDNPIGKQVSLIIVDPATMTLYSKAVTITEAGIQVDSQSKTILGGDSSNSNDIAITRVIKGN